MSRLIVINRKECPNDWIYRSAKGHVTEVGQRFEMVELIANLIGSMPEGQNVVIHREDRVRKLTILDNDNFEEGSFWFERFVKGSNLCVSYRIKWEKLKTNSSGVEVVCGRYEPTM